MPREPNYTPFPVDVRGRCYEFRADGSLRSFLQIFSKSNPLWEIQREDRQPVIDAALGQFENLSKQSRFGIRRDAHWIYIVEVCTVDLMAFDPSDPNWELSEHIVEFERNIFDNYHQLCLLLKGRFDIAPEHLVHSYELSYLG